MQSEQNKTRLEPGVKRTDAIYQVFERTINKESIMLWTIALVLLILWLLGFVVYPVGGLIHLLLVIALIVVIVRLIQGRKVV
jgi:hypothetical protein